MWYVIQTITGKEQELAGMIEQILRGEGYKKCFVICQECVWRIEGGYKTYVKPLFPSYIFAETDNPEEFFLSLKRVPRFARLLGNEGGFWTVQEEERELLCSMMEDGREDEGEYVLRRSRVWVNDEGEIVDAEGFLKNYLNRIIKKRLRKRSVTIEIPFLGEMRRIQVGIRVAQEDLET